MISADEAARRTRRRAKRAVVAGAIVGVLVLVLVVALVVNTAGGGKVGGEEQGGAAPGSGAAPVGPGGENGSAATLSASTVTWSEIYGAPIPTSAAGPHKSEKGLAAGFDQSPDGAVLAGIHILTRASGTYGPKVFRPTINLQMVGSDKGILLSKVEAEYQRLKALGPTGRNGELVTELAKGRQQDSGVWGYRLDGYTPDTAFVQLLSRTTPAGSAQPTYVNVGLSLKWAEGDWRLSAPPQGEWKNVSRLVPNPPADYIALGRD